MTQPLHERIRRDIETRILSGALAPGERLPVEHELMRDHGCSRMTVSKALSALASAGLVERRKRAGSFVARPRVHAMVLDVPDLAGEVAARGQTYAWRLLTRSIRGARSADETVLAGGGRLLAIDGLHVAGGIPLAVEHRIVSLAAVPEIAAVDLAIEPPGGWLLHHVPWTEAETRIAALGADSDAARLLEIPVGTACLSIERATLRGGDRITWVRQVFVGNGYDLVARFGPTGQ